MSFTSRIDRHARLMDRMAASLGVDLTEAALRGRLPAPDLRGLTMNCMSCRETGACEEFLAEAEAGGGAFAAPPYCRNRETLNRLAMLD
jgi:hypothetical protein